MLIRKGFVDKEKIWKFVKSFEDLLEDETWNGRVNVSGRKCVWLGLGVNLGIKSEVYQGLDIDNGLRRKCNELWSGDDWNSILIYKYEPGTELKEHIDRDLFEDKVVLINVSVDDLFGGNIRFIYQGKEEILSNGEIIEFNNKVKHGIKKVDEERWSVSVRKIKV
ncbi:MULTISPECIES: hypothetical protein [Nostocales]|uniref:Fe2OG dioxygenase domain-containing protein n=1 Tax=Tolypothrix bouteillei VB521301 TaxID=1479485 RepID=A0A0C1N5E1_9CYAN